jgi:hypothetical protein
MFQTVFHISDDELPSSSNSDDDDDHENDGGVYRAKTWGPPGQRLQVIMLDTRYGRSPFYSFIDSSSGASVYAPPPLLDDNDFPQTMLSPSQWKWLQEQLQQPAIDLRLIVSSIQVLNDVTGYECWRHLPKERQRLYNLLRQTQQSMIRDNNITTTNNDNDVSSSSSNTSLLLAPILLLSGDRHVGGFYTTSNNHDHDHDNDNDDDDNANNNDNIILYEVTASSWTHSFPLDLHSNTCTTTAALCEENDPRRLGNLIHEK